MPSVDRPSVKWTKASTGLSAKNIFQHHAVHANTLLLQARLSHENVRKMTRRPGPIQFNLCNQQFANI